MNMKKLMIAASAALCATVGFGLESANVVGYYTVNVEKEKFALVAINMEPTSTEVFTLDELFPTNALTTSGGSSGNADQLQVWDYENQTYKNFYRFYKKMGGGAKNYHWVNTADDSLATVTLKAGDSVFYYAKGNNQTLTIPGTVPNQASGILKQGFNMVGVGFPSTWNPNSEGADFWKDSTKFTAAGSSGNADQIQYWDDENQTYKFYYLFYKKMGGGSKNYSWVDTTTDEVLNEPLKIGSGFFYYKQSAGEIEFKPNLKLAN
jgi:hypothetical protein